MEPVDIMKLKKKRYGQWFGLINAILSLIAAIVITQYFIKQQANRPAPVQSTEPQYADVAVLEIKGAEHAAKISGYGEATPHFSMTLTSQVSGEVVSQAETFEAGCRVTKGTVLLQLEDSDYRSTVAEAESELASARLALLEEQRGAAQAVAEWKNSGLTGTPDSDLVLHEPQLKAAEAAVSMAVAALESAEKDLSRTRIIAPFDALVVKRMTAPGSYLQAGSEVATLYSTDVMEIAIPLTSRDWASLPETEILTADRRPVQLTGVESGGTWAGRILRAEQHLDTESRQRTLLVAVDSPLDQSPKLLAGTFVEAAITGRILGNVWQLPGSALSQRGEVWYVGDNNTLGSFSTEPLFSEGEYIYVEVPPEFAATALRIVVHPLSSYLPGMIVNPVPAMENDNA
jgi:RND family efflux transporter MFP subunit